MDGHSKNFLNTQSAIHGLLEYRPSGMQRWPPLIKMQYSTGERVIYLDKRPPPATPPPNVNESECFRFFAIQEEERKHVAKEEKLLAVLLLSGRTWTPGIWMSKEVIKSLVEFTHKGSERHALAMKNMRTGEWGRVLHVKWVGGSLVMTCVVRYMLV